MDLKSTIYSAMINYLEELENRKAYLGNSHHLCQKLTEMVANELED